MNQFVKLLQKNICNIMILILVVIIINSLHNAGYFSEIYQENFEMNNEPALVCFHANWCGHCKKLMPDWLKFEKEYHGHKGINVINVESENKDVMKKHNIDGFPTIKYCPTGLNNADNTKLYEGERSHSGLVDFLKSIVN